MLNAHLIAILLQLKGENTDEEKITLTGEEEKRTIILLYSINMYLNKLLKSDCQQLSEYSEYKSARLA